MENLKRILIFGSSGVGKTSLLNTVTGEDHSTSSKSNGCTFETTYYKPFMFRDDTYEFVDTVGLNEGLLGTVSNKDAISNLIKLILTNKRGFNLLVMVMKCGRIYEATEHQYNFFVKKLSGESVPVILVVTHCENEESLSAWAENSLNKSALAKYSMKFSAIIGVTCGKSKNAVLESLLSHMRIESKNNFLTTVEKYSLDSPHKIAEKGLIMLLRKTYKFIAHLMNWSPWNGSLADLLKSLGLSKHEFLQIENQFSPIIGSANEISNMENSSTPQERSSGKVVQEGNNLTPKKGRGPETLHIVNSSTHPDGSVDTVSQTENGLTPQDDSKNEVFQTAKNLTPKVGSADDASYIDNSPTLQVCNTEKSLHGEIMQIEINSTAKDDSANKGSHMNHCSLQESNAEKVSQAENIFTSEKV